MPLAADDPDLAHLFELLRMLPGPQDNREFWTAVQHSFLGEDTELGYVYQKMSTVTNVAKQPTPQNIEYLTRYLLFFFAGERPALWKTLNAIFRSELRIVGDEPGRWWAEDTCHTAWILYVRYRRVPGEADWTRKWEYEDHATYRDWLGLPDRQ